MTVYKCLSGALVAVFLFLTTSGFAFELTSTDFKNNSAIQALHTCDGKNLSPHISWSNMPPGTQSYVLICHDPDAPAGDFVHWIIYDIPASVSSIAGGGPIPAGARQLANDFGKPGYGGPCPPSGTHRYIFTLHALNTARLDAVSRDSLMKKIREHQTGSATLTGLYKRK